MLKSRDLTWLHRLFDQCEVLATYIIPRQSCGFEDLPNVGIIEAET